MYRKMLTLSSRAKDLTNLANALGKIIDQERKAFGLDEDKGGDDGQAMGLAAEALLEAIKRSGKELSPPQ